MADGLRRLLLALISVPLLAHLAAGDAERLAMQAIGRVYEFSVSPTLANASKMDYGNKMVNRYLPKLGKKIKEILTGGETTANQTKKFVDKLEAGIDNSNAFKVAIHPPESGKFLDQVIEKLCELKTKVHQLLDMQKAAKTTAVP